MLHSRIHKSGNKVLSARGLQSTLFLVFAITFTVSIRMAFAFSVLSKPSFHTCSRSIMKRKHEGISSATTTRLLGTTSNAADSNTRTNTTDATTTSTPPQEPVSLYRSQGIFCVEKPLNWTSNDVVSYIRGILERDARQRGAKPVKVTSRRNKSRILRVGHGGTLDPLASGVLVIGVGKGTKELQR